MNLVIESNLEKSIFKLYNNKCILTNSYIENKSEIVSIITHNDCNKINDKIKNLKYNNILLKKEFINDFKNYNFTFDFINYKQLDKNKIEIPILTDLYSVNSVFYNNKIITLPYTCLYFIKYHYLKYKEKKSKFEIDTSYLKDINHISEYDDMINICDNENNIIMLPIDYSF